MTPQQAIRIAAITDVLDGIARGDAIDGYLPPDHIGEANVDAEWERLQSTDQGADYLSEVLSELRHGDESGLPPRYYSRHYECTEVAAMRAGKWVGWSYWHGGGKHGEPEAVDWVDDAYFLDVEESQRTVTVRVFTVRGTDKSGAPKVVGP